MTTRTRTETIVFKHAFRIKGVDRLLPAGAYDVVSEDEVISIASTDLADAQRIDASVSH